MKRRTPDFDWNHARAFLATAQHGSLSAAARALGLTQPTLGRQVAALERELAVALFERVGRGLVLTPSGEALLEHVRGMGQSADRIALAASGHSGTLEGPIRITASEVYAASLLPPILAALRAEHPGITVEIVASNRPTDLLRREADVAIRNFETREPELIARRLPDDRARAYAAPSCLARLGAVSTWAELAGASFLGFARPEAMIEGLRAYGLDLTPAHFPLRCDSHLVQWEYVKRGFGIGLITEAVGEAEPAVRRVLPEAAPIRIPVWLATHRELHMSRRVRLVFDRIAAALAPG